MPDLEIQLEKIADKIPQLMRMDLSTVWNRLKQAKVEVIGEANFRMPMKLTEGWVFGQITTDGGSNFRGSGPTYNQMLGTFVEFGMAGELSTRRQIVGGNPNTAPGAALSMADLMANLVPEWSAALEGMMHTNGKPFCFTATATATVSSTTQYTGDTIMGARSLRKGAAVTVYDTTGTTVKGNGYVADIDYDARTVRLSVTIAGALGTDILTYGNFTGASPAGLYGLRFWADTASTGTMLGINRALESEVRASGVAAAGASLSQDHVLQLQHKMAIRRGAASIDNLTWFISSGQRAQILQSTQSIQKIELTGSGAVNILDRLPNTLGQNTFQWAGGQVFEYCPLQPNDRVDATILSNYRKAELYPEQFYQDENGKKIHAVVSTANGLPMFISWVGYIAGFQVFNLVPRDNGAITGLLIPSGYN